MRLALAIAAALAAPQVAQATAPCPNTILGAGVRLCSTAGLERKPFGLVAIAGPVTVRNDSARRVADIVIECRAIAQSGTVLSTVRHVLYVTVEAGGTLNLPGSITLGHMHQQAVTARCDIAGYRN